MGHAWVHERPIAAKSTNEKVDENPAYLRGVLSHSARASCCVIVAGRSAHPLALLESFPARSGSPSGGEYRTVVPVQYSEYTRTEKIAGKIAG